MTNFKTFFACDLVISFDLDIIYGVSCILISLISNLFIRKIMLDINIILTHFMYFFYC